VIEHLIEGSRNSAARSKEDLDCHFAAERAELGRTRATISRKLAGRQIGQTPSFAHHILPLSLSCRSGGENELRWEAGTYPLTTYLEKRADNKDKRERGTGAG